MTTGRRLPPGLRVPDFTPLLRRLGQAQAARERVTIEHCVRSGGVETVTGVVTVVSMICATLWIEGERCLSVPVKRIVAVTSAEGSR